MSANRESVNDLVYSSYQHGFVTDIEADTVPPGLSEDVIRTISARKQEPEWMLERRLEAYHHWLTLEEPEWAHVHHAPIDFQAISFYSAPKKAGDGPQSLDEVDPQLLDAYNKLGIPLD